MTVIRHLSLVKSEKDIAGQRRSNMKHQRSMVTTSMEKGAITKTIPLLPKDVSNKPWRGVIATLMIKEEPPDTHIPSHMNRQKDFGLGKYLDSYLCRDTNLLYLGTGDIVSRSKPFQEGEYDEDIKSSSTKEHGTRTQSFSVIHQDLPYSSLCALKGFTLQQLFPFLFSHDLETLYMNPTTSSISLSCTRAHVISHDIPKPNLPYLDPIDIKLQRLFPNVIGCDLEAYTSHQKFPKALRIFPKLTRYKQINKFLLFSQDAHIKGPTASNIY